MKQCQPNRCGNGPVSLTPWASLCDDNDRTTRQTSKKGLRVIPEEERRVEAEGQEGGIASYNAPASVYSRGSSRSSASRYSGSRKTSRASDATERKFAPVREDEHEYSFDPATAICRPEDYPRVPDVVFRFSEERISPVPKFEYLSESVFKEADITDHKRMRW
ncbi:hypothetical protein TWF225_005739 [Orbilia oligospora]|nr:hypothetical protein TWF225_005739 [Orbilia oligospora]KAF3271337.1 hypothetical protein TWF217_005735 [Orbilia oligospora]KAF3271895.1 hypothetical protein TWF128_000421 [Orbilia oligospora]KAF3293525.1 hypothetical protein TWF132_004494 [Orbilia oligospora]